MADKKRVLAHLAIFGANLIYGINYSVAKGLMPEHLTPFAFIFCRVFGALILFLLFASMRKTDKIERNDFWRLALCGLFGVAGNQLMFFYGLNLTSPINAAIIMTSNPILVMIFAALIIKAKITATKLAGVFLGLAGAAALILHGNQLSVESDGLIGDLFIFLNGTSYALYLVLVKPLMSKYSPLTVIKWVFLFGAFYVFPFGFQEVQQVEWSSFTPTIWYSFIFVVVGTTFLAYLFNIYGLKRLNPTTVSTYIYSQPLIASIIAILFYDGELTFVKVLSALLIFSGVYLVSIRKSAQTKA
ncbi:MAG: EamA family transporter [Flavobacteriales bacterium]|nr:EamA family transporter [Flavobacteriales bacterium]|tara:strand:- start:557 stop:1459 length:903 start_codon:yes stop_codon:yes gene_type:complete